MCVWHWHLKWIVNVLWISPTHLCTWRWISTINCLSNVKFQQATCLFQVYFQLQIAELNVKFLQSINFLTLNFIFLRTWNFEVCVTFSNIKFIWRSDVEVYNQIFIWRSISIFNYCLFWYWIVACHIAWRQSTVYLMYIVYLIFLMCIVYLNIPHSFVDPAFERYIRR